jgi:hypothetical protein
MGEAIGRLLEVDRERDIVAEIVRGAERREKSVSLVLRERLKKC